MRQSLTSNWSLSFRRFSWVWVPTRLSIDSEFSMKRSIEHWSIRMNSKKNCWGNAENSPKILLQVRLSYNLPLSFLMMTRIPFRISKLKFQKLTSTLNFPGNMKKYPNKKYKNLRPKWSDCIPWCNKINPSMKAVLLLWASTQSPMRSFKRKSNFFPFPLNQTKHNCPKSSKETVTMKNLKLSSRRNMMSCWRKKPNNKSR